MEKLAARFLFGGILLLFVSAFLLSHFLTLGYDEAWLLSYALEIYKGQKFSYKLAPNSITSGGLFPLLNAFLISIFGLHLWIYRFLSFLSLTVTTGILWNWTKQCGMNVLASLIVLSFFLMMPGTIELSAMAFSELPAMLGFFAALYLLHQYPSKNLAIGILLGIAASERSNLLIIFPALFFERMLFSENKTKQLKQLIPLLFYGALSFLIFQSVVLALSEDSAPRILQNSIRDVGLASFWPDYPRILNKWIVANGFLPFYLMVAISCFAWFDTSPLCRIMRVLLIFGWLHWLAWILLAPIAHLRYLWPTLASFGVIGGFGLASLFMWAKKMNAGILQASILLVGLGCITQTIATTFRTLIHGESNILSWEWSRETPLSNYHWYRYAPNQQKMVQYLIAHTKKGEPIATFTLDLELEILSGVKIVPISHYFDKDHWKKEVLPSRILVTPLVGKYLYLSPELIVWMKNHMTKEAEFGDYALYRINGHYPPDSMMFRFSHQPYAKTEIPFHKNQSPFHQN